MKRKRIALSSLLRHFRGRDKQRGIIQCIIIRLGYAVRAALIFQGLPHTQTARPCHRIPSLTAAAASRRTKVFVPHQYMSAREIKDLHAFLPLEFREKEGQTRPLCSVFSSCSSHSASVRSRRRTARVESSFVAELRSLVPVRINIDERQPLRVRRKKY